MDFRTAAGCKSLHTSLCILNVHICMCKALGTEYIYLNISFGILNDYTYSHKHAHMADTHLGMESKNY